MQDSSQAEVDALIAAFFGAFDNRNGRTPDHAGLARMFADRAVVAMHQRDRCVLCSPEEFIAPRMALLGSGELVDFHEWEESARTEIIGSLAVRVSRYAKCGSRNGAAVAGSGTKFFQLARFDHGWKVVALSWIDDD